MYLKASAFAHEQCQIPLQSSYTALYHLSYLIERFWILSSSDFQSFQDYKNPFKLKILIHVPPSNMIH